MIYTDGIHLISESIAELHLFAKKIELKRCWFENKPFRPHYDLMISPKNRQIMLEKALFNGAILISDKELIDILIKYFQK